MANVFKNPIITMLLKFCVTASISSPSHIELTLSKQEEHVKKGKSAAFVIPMFRTFVQNCYLRFSHLIGI